MVLFGAASGPVPPFDPQRLNAGGSLTLTRPTMAHFVQNTHERRWRSAEIFDAAANGTLAVRVGATYPWPKQHRPTVTWKAAGPPAKSCFCRKSQARLPNNWRPTGKQWCKKM